MLLGVVLLLFDTGIITLEMSTDVLLFCGVGGMVFGLGKADDVIHWKCFLVGGSRLRKGSASQDGRTLRIDHSLECRREVRALIRAKKQGNACGAKGGRKANGRTT